MKNLTGSCISTSELDTCVCRSMRPGITNLPVRSCTAAPAGAFSSDAGPIHVMRPSVAIRALFAAGAPPLPSIKVKLFRTSTSAAGADGGWCGLSLAVPLRRSRPPPMASAKKNPLADRLTSSAPGPLPAAASLAKG